MDNLDPEPGTGFSQTPESLKKFKLEKPQGFKRLSYMVFFFNKKPALNTPKPQARTLNFLIWRENLRFILIPE